MLVRHFNYVTELFAWMISGCYFQEGPDVKMDMEVDSAYQKALETVTRWIHREVNTNKTQVFFRSYAPVHFRFALNTHFYSTIHECNEDSKAYVSCQGR